MTQPGRSSLLAVLLHERFHQSHDWFTTPPLLEQDDDTESVPDQKPEVD